MIVGRKKEIQELNDILNSNKAELVAVYGRRRVGKTYLINEAYKDYIVFRHTGLPPISNSESTRDLFKRQLDAFYYSLLKYNDENIKKPKTWIEAFFLLEKYLDKYSTKKIVVFIDELPWMDIPKTHFIEAFTYFWNNYCSYHNNIVLIVCGSSSSWILDNVIHNPGGLYGRVTHQIRLSPFNLKETQNYLQTNNISYSHYEISEVYMITGGIPYYLNYFRNGMSVAQNIDNMFFNTNAILSDEFDELFTSQFTSPEIYKKIVETLGDKHSGYTSQELTSTLNLVNNGNYYKMLKALLNGEFIRCYVPFGKNKNEKFYQLIDPFCIFYLKHMKNNKNKNNYWQTNYDKQNIVSWRGFAFENICINHINQIKFKLGIIGISTNESQFVYRGSDNQKGSQIDLLIERSDNILNLCEIKYYSNEITITKDIHLNLMNKVEVIRTSIKKKQSIQNILITTFGIKQSEYRSDFPIVVTLEDLFAF